MANDNHFRIKNGLKVGDTEVISASAKITASTVTISGTLLPTKLDSFEDSLSSFSATLGVYEDSLHQQTLIEALKDSASAAYSAALSAQLAADQNRADSFSALTAAQQHQSDADTALGFTQGFKSSASAANSAALAAKQSASAAKVSASSLKVSASSRKVSASASKVSASSAKVLAENAKSDAEAAKTLAQTYSLSASGAAVAAIDARDNAISYQSTACSAKLAASGYEVSALLAKQSASGSEVTALNASNNAVNYQGTACAAKLAASGYEVAALSAKQSASGHEVTASNASGQAVNYQSTACAAKLAASGYEVSALAAKQSASGHEVTALNASGQAVNYQSTACAAKLAASGYEVSALAAKQSASGHEVTASNASGQAVNYQSTACAAKLAASGYEVSALAAKQSASGHEVTASNASGQAVNYQSTACAAKLAASGYEVSALAAKQSASGHEVTASNASGQAVNYQSTACAAKLAASGYEVSALAAKQSASGHEVTASNASGQAVNYQGTACAAKLAASGYEVAALSAKQSASGHEVTASNASGQAVNYQSTACAAKLAASGYEVSALAAKQSASGHEVTASNASGQAVNYQSTACAAKLAASGYEVSALSAKQSASGHEVTAANASGQAVNYQSTACAAKLAASGYEVSALSAKQSASGHEVTASNASGQAINYQGTACAAKLAASSYEVAALSAKQSASGHEVSALNASGQAIQHQSSACAAKLAASSFSVTALNAKETASGAAVTATNASGLATNAKNSASSSASAANVQLQTATSAADDIGALSSNVESVRLLDARITSGINGHYSGNYWYLQSVGSGTGVNAAKVVALQNGGVIYLEEVPSPELVTNGTFAAGLDGWTEETDAGDAVVSNGIVTLNDTGTDGYSYIYQRITVENGQQYTAVVKTGDIDATSAGTLTDVFIGISGAYDGPDPFQYGAKKLSDGTLAPNTTYEITFTTVATNVDIVLYNASGQDAEFISASLRKGSSAPQTKIIKQNAEAGVPYTIPSLTGITGEGYYNVHSSVPIVVKHAKGYMGVPANFSSRYLALNANRDFPTKAVLYSPYKPATVQVYIDSVENAPSTNSIFKEGKSPIAETFTIPAGEYYEWSSDDIGGWMHTPADDDDTYTAVFVSDVKVLGMAYNTDGSTDYKPLAPMTSGEVLSATSAQYKYPRIVTGGGLQTYNLALALQEHAAGGLASQAPNLAALFNSSNGSFPYGDISSNNVINSYDSSQLLKYVTNATDYNTGTKTRAEQLIDHVESQYGSIENSFSAAGVVYKIFTAEPETNTNISITNNCYSSACSIRTLFSVTGIGDGAGSDSDIGIPRQGLSDFYIYPSTTLTNFKITSVEPATISVLNASGTVLYTIDHEAATKANPLYHSQGTSSGSGSDLGSGAGPYTFIGTAPFYLICQDDSDDETTMLGALQSMLGEEGRQSAVAEDLTSVTSTVDGHTVDITTQASSINGLEGQYSVKINNNGFVSGFGLSSSNVNSPESAFVIQADRFSIVDPQVYDENLTLTPDATTIPFQVVDGITRIKNAFVGNLSANNIDAASITGDKLTSNVKIEVYDEDNKTATYSALDGADPVYRFYVGNEDPAKAAFSVTTAGDVALSSLKLKGFDGSYFDSNTGLGLAALGQISEFVKSGRIDTDSENTVGDLNTSTDTTYFSKTLTLTSDIYQQYRIPANEISFTKEVSHVSTINRTFVLELGDGSRTTGTFAYGDSDILGPRRTTEPGEPDNFVTDLPLGRALQVGELIAIRWSENLPSGSTISWTNVVDYETDAAFSNTPVGPGTNYTQSIIGKVNAIGAPANFTITRPSITNFTYTGSNNTVATPDVRSLARATLPYYITLEPKRHLVGGSTVSFMANSEAENPFNSNGIRTYSAIEEDDTFSDTISQYRVIVTPTSTSYGFLSATAYIDSRPGVETGAVDSSGYFTSYTTSLQTGSNALSSGTYKWGSILECLNSSGNPYNEGNTFEASLNRLIETESLAEYGEFYVEPQSKTVYEEVEFSDIRAEIRPGYHTDGGTAYGLVFSGQSYVMIENDSVAFDGSGNQQYDEYRQAIFLGNVSDDPANTTEKDNLFVVASRRYDSGTYDRKLHLDVSGRLHINSMSAESATIETINFADGTSQTTAPVEEPAYWHRWIYAQGDGGTDPNTPSSFYSSIATNPSKDYGQDTFYSRGSMANGSNQMQVTDSTVVLYTMWVYNTNGFNVSKTMKVFRVDDEARLFVNSHSTATQSRTGSTFAASADTAAAPAPLDWTFSLQPGYNKIQVLTYDHGGDHFFEANCPLIGGGIRFVPETEKDPTDNP